MTKSPLLTPRQERPGKESEEMNYFEQELRKLFEDSAIMESPAFIGRECLGSLGGDLRVKARFMTTRVADHYDAVELTVLNRTGGPVDAVKLELAELWGKKDVPGNPNFPDGVSPHIRVYDGRAEWNAYSPTGADYRALRQAAERHLKVFREQTREREQDGPKLIYICAPLRGDVEKSVAFAKEKAQEVFKSGDIPICPHLMFPPIAEVGDSPEDQKGREMGLKLVESCQQVNVYGPIWTEGMWAEILHAEQSGIPVVTDRKTIGRSTRQASKGQRQR